MFKITECKHLKSLYNPKDELFLKKCVTLSYNGMENLNHWNYDRTKFFNAIPKNLKIVEVGVHCGKNAYRIYKVCNPKKLYLVDPWNRVSENKNQTQNTNLVEQQNAEKCCRLYFEDKKNVVILKKWSSEGSECFNNGELDFVYIDADHSYKALLNDLTLWSKKVKKGGFLGGHDYDNKGGFAQQALETFLKLNNNWKIIYTPPAHLWGVGSSDGHYDFLLQS